MTDIIEYLYEKARELHEFMVSTPEIKDDLLRMAQELEEKAAELEKLEFRVSAGFLART
jgi:hypothetical protein